MLSFFGVFFPYSNTLTHTHSYFNICGPYPLECVFPGLACTDILSTVDKTLSIHHSHHSIFVFFFYLLTTHCTISFGAYRRATAIDCLLSLPLT